MSDILKAIIYCHKRNIVHRDIKAENILFEGRDISSACKLIDFGISLKFTKDSKLKDKTGTILYVAPEVLRGSYDEKCDVWACGVLLYLILCGYPPFYGSSRKSVMRKILKDKPTFHGPVWKKVSYEAKELIKLMLTKNPDLRPSASETLNHAWFKSNEMITPFKTLTTKNYLESLAKYNASCKLSQAIMTYIVSNASYKEVTEDIRQAFQSLDRDGDGKITKEELVQAFSEAYEFKDKSQVEKEVATIIDDIDTDISGSIDYTEFLVACINKEKMLSQKMVSMAFRQFDLNGDGYITRPEFQAVMGGIVLDQMSWNEFLLYCDSDKDERVSI